MLSWLWNLFKEDPENPHTWDGEYRAFLKGLADKEAPSISGRWSLSIYCVTLSFGDVEVEVEYNTVRDEWEIETWSHQAQEFLFYYDCLDSPPWKSINFLLDRYKIKEIVEKAVKQKKAAKNRSAKVAQNVINKYTGK